MSKFIVCFICILSSGSIMAQSGRIMQVISLKNKLVEAVSVEDSILLLYELGKAYRPLQLDSADHYLSQCVNLIGEIPSGQLAGDAILAYADVLALKEDPRAGLYFKMSLATYQREHLRGAEIEVICRICTYARGSNATEYYIGFIKEAYALWNETMSNKRKGYVLYILGVLYARENDFEQAQQMFQQSLHFCLLANHKKPVALISEFGNLYFHKGKYRLALEMYQSALPYLQKEDHQLAMSYIYSNIAMTQFKLGQDDAALSSYKASVQFRINSNYMIGLKYTYLKMSQFFAQRAEPGMARKWFEKATSISDTITVFAWEESFSNALIYVQEDRLDLARQEFKKVENILQRITTTDHFELIYAKADFFLQQGVLDSAMIYSLKAIDFADSVDNTSLLAQAYLIHANLLFRQGDVGRSIDVLRSALNFIEKEESPVIAAELMGYLALYLNHSSCDGKDALEVLEQLKEFSNEIQQHDKNFRLSALVDEFDLRLKKDEINLLYARENGLMLLLSVFGILILCVWVYAYRQRKQKEQVTAKQEEARRVYEQSLLEKSEKLESDVMDRTRDLMEKNKMLQDQKNRELTAKVLQMVQQNGLFDSIKKQLIDVEKKLEGEARLELRKAVKNLSGSIALRRDWENFTLYFERIHPDFFSRINELCPKLTSEDLKYCAYIKLNMSNRDIAELLHINSESVRVHKYRLKKKMGLPRDVDLGAFIRSFS